MYLDGGLDPVRGLILQVIVGPELERMALAGSELPVTDFKSALQEMLQALGQPQPSYVLVKEEGPEHSKTFTVEARLRASAGVGKADLVGRAAGSTKKKAEQDAARQVLEQISALPRIATPKSARKGQTSASQ
jgi:ribonuclease III